MKDVKELVKENLGALDAEEKALVEHLTKLKEERDNLNSTQ